MQRYRAQHAPQNAMDDPGEIQRFHDRCSDLMRELLDALAAAPDHPRSFPEIEDSISWPRRRIASVPGGVWHSAPPEFGGRRPYRFLDEHQSQTSGSGLWIMSVLQGNFWGIGLHNVCDAGREPQEDKRLPDRADHH
jgi:hypothetical protein